MRTSRRKLPYGKIVPIILIISIIFGFCFDLICTAIEYKIYPKPAEYESFVKEYSDIIKSINAAIEY